MQLILVVGLKGGVGKTTTAIGLAQALRRRGEKVGILDLDYRTPNVLVALGWDTDAPPQRTSDDTLIAPVVDGIAVWSTAYQFPERQAIMVEDADAMREVLQMLTPGVIDWGDASTLVVDTPPTAVGVVRVALEADDVRGALIISHASTLARMDTLRTINLFAEKRVPILGLVCNQSVDDHGRLRYDLTAADIEAIGIEFGLPFFTEIPHMAERDGYYDRLAEAAIHVEPVTLSVPEPSEERWKRTVKALERL